MEADLRQSATNPVFVPRHRGAWRRGGSVDNGPAAAEAMPRKNPAYRGSSKRGLCIELALVRAVPSPAHNCLSPFRRSDESTPVGVGESSCFGRVDAGSRTQRRRFGYNSGMEKWPFKIGLLVSFGLLVACFAIFVAANYIDPRDHFISLSDDCHVSLCKRRIVIYNDSDYGPYTGSIISLSEETGPETTEFGDAWGIYFRHFRWLDGSVLWTLAVSLWYPVFLASILPGYWCMSRFFVAPKLTVP